MSVASESGEVIVRVEGGVGRLTLNRPQALHALTLGMCATMLEALAAWRSDPAVEMVLIDHAGPRGFCAGGDVRRAAGDGAAAAEFFFVEYRLNHMLFTYEKPTVCLMDGVVMGGGAGVALPCDYRIGTEALVFAMPEATIGLFPDVGGGWWLSRLRGGLGLWLALTSARLESADCLMAGIATDIIAKADVETFRAALLEAPGEIERLLTEMEADPGRPIIVAHREDIDRHFSQDSVEQVLQSLRADPSDWAVAQVAAIGAKSPQALKIAHRLLHEGRTRARFADELLVEYRIAVRAAASHDFREGVRALLIDKDGAPQWSPSTLEAVTDGRLAEFFAPLPTEREWTPLT
jgi:enoyl-CoA hydratase